MGVVDDRRLLGSEVADDRGPIADRRGDFLEAADRPAHPLHGLRGSRGDRLAVHDVALDGGERLGRRLPLSAGDERGDELWEAAPAPIMNRRRDTPVAADMAT